MVAVGIMCNKHLVAEHLEMHMFAGALRKGTSMKGYIDKGLLEIVNIAPRHDALVEEMVRRGMKHKSPLGAFPRRPEEYGMGRVDVRGSERELRTRCEECKARQAVLRKR